VFEIPADFRLGSDDNAALRDADLKAEAPWMQNAKLRELELEPPLNREPASLAHECKDRALRFSEDDRTASFECLYSVDQRTSTVQWIPASITDADSGAAARAAIAGAKNVVADTGNTLKSCAIRDGPPRTSRVTSVFLGPRTGSGSGFVTVQGDGYVQIWHDGQPPCLSTQFRSDFVRVATGGRPATLDVQDVAVPRPMYAIYALSPTPVVRVYEQDARHARLLMEHYPPAGVGTPVGIRFTQNARCLQIRANRTSGGGLAAVDYYLILDLDRLLAIGRALEEDLGSATTVTDVPLARYSRAIEKECYGR